MKFVLTILLFVLTSFASAQSLTRVADEGGYWRVTPLKSNGVLFILIPGGLVPAEAYGFIGERLAGQGITTIIPESPLGIAFFDYTKGIRIRLALEAKGETFRKIIYGGHSLGGAMAGLLAGFGERMDGLILMAAFPAADCSARNLPTLTIAAELDGLISVSRVRDSLAQLPKNSQLEVINGGIHAFFGRYGVQARDGTPTISREAFETRLLEIIVKFMAQF
jgi:pimeloyl-ACP methyl ester carboxylesterase